MTIKEAQEKIIKEFEKLENEIDKYNYLIKLGKKLPSLDPEDKTKNNLIESCQVKTWFNSEFKNGKVYYNIDSKSLITKGLISLLIRTLSDQKPEDVEKADLYFIDELDLKDNFSTVNPSNLWEVVKRMKKDASFYKNN